MLSFMLTISFLVHVIMFIIVYSLFQQIQSLKKVNTDEVTDLFEHYLQEIKEENIRLESEISKQTLRKNQQPVAGLPVKSNIKQHEKQSENIEEKYIPPIHTINDEYEPSLEAQVLQMHQQGVSVDEIAKSLDCGKTEATLIIKISEQKDLYT